MCATYYIGNMCASGRGKAGRQEAETEAPQPATGVSLLSVQRLVAERQTEGRGRTSVSVNLCAKMMSGTCSVAN